MLVQSEVISGDAIHGFGTAAHLVQTVAPSDAAYQPAGQSTQLLCCGPGEVTSGQSAMPSIADTTTRMNEFAQLEANLQRFANDRATARGQAPPFQINVQVDSETVARATHNANQDNASRAFTPVPAY